MSFSWKEHLITGSILASSLLGYSQNSSFADSVMTESKKHPTTTHFLYKIMDGSPGNFHNTDTLETIIENVERQYPKKEKYSREEAIDILETTGKEVENMGLFYIKHKFDCDDLSFIYLAVGEKLNLPLYAVSYPEHLFVRYDPDGKHNALDSTDIVNKGDFNWETTTNELKSDEYYLEQNEDLRGTSKELIKSNFYLKNLTKKNLISIAYSNKGSWNEGGPAIKDYTHAIELDSTNLIAYLNRGVVLGLKGDSENAIQDYNKAIELNPFLSKAYQNKGIVLARTKKYDEAIQNYSVAIEIDPYNPMNYYLRGLAFSNKKDYDKSNEDIDTAKKLILMEKYLTKILNEN